MKASRPQGSAGRKLDATHLHGSAGAAEGHRLRSADPGQPPLAATPKIEAERARGAVLSLTGRRDTCRAEGWSILMGRRIRRDRITTNSGRPCLSAKRARILSGR